MSHKSNLKVFPSIIAGAMVGDLTSKVTNIQFLDLIGIQANVVSGTPTGVLAVQVSADYNQDDLGNVLNTGHWITLTSQAITSGNPTFTYIDLTPTSAPWIRTIYTHTSGTGVLNTFVTGKSV